MIAFGLIGLARAEVRTLPIQGAPSKPVLGTFLDFYRDLTPELWALEFRYMKQSGIRNVVVESVGRLRAAAGSGYALSPQGLLYPSGYIDASGRPKADRLEMILSLADEQQMKVYLGSLQTAENWTDGSEFEALRFWNRRVASEILQRYGQHRCLNGWYFTQEIWMNWVKYYSGSPQKASGYYGTKVMADWASDMKLLDATKETSAAIVFKEAADGVMPGLSADELRTWMRSFLAATQVDLMMPQDGQGAGHGAPTMEHLPQYFAAMAEAVRERRVVKLWSTLELFSSRETFGNERYPPAAFERVEQQIKAERPFVGGYMTWIYGNDLSPQATFYPVKAEQLNRSFRKLLQPEQPQYEAISIRKYLFSKSPNAKYPDSLATPKLTDGNGGGYGDASIWSSFVGFANDDVAEETVEVVGDLGCRRNLAQVRALTMSQSTAGILRPDAMRVDISKDGLHWTAFGAAGPFPADTASYSVLWGEASGTASARYVRWTFLHRQWLMLAELQVAGPAHQLP